MKQVWQNGSIQFFGDAVELSYGANFLNLVDSLYRLDWIAFCKKPFKSPAIVVKYLGRYTHRVAISNSRIVDFNGSFVTFKWKDYKDKNKVKFMTLKTKEFVRRFLLHVFPTGFTKIRHYGILSSCNIKTKLPLCFKLSGSTTAVFTVVRYAKRCPLCGNAMVFAHLLAVSAAEP